MHRGIFSLISYFSAKISNNSSVTRKIVLPRVTVKNEPSSEQNGLTSIKNDPSSEQSGLTSVKNNPNIKANLSKKPIKH